MLDNLLEYLSPYLATSAQANSLHQEKMATMKAADLAYAEHRLAQNTPY